MYQRTNDFYCYVYKSAADTKPLLIGTVRQLPEAVRLFEEEEGNLLTGDMLAVVEEYHGEYRIMLEMGAFTNVPKDLPRGAGPLDTANDLNTSCVSYCARGIMCDIDHTHDRGWELELDAVY